jgi:hypothetical protein
MSTNGQRSFDRGTQPRTQGFDPLRIPMRPGEDSTAYHARVQRDYPDAWIAMLRDWQYQARMNRDHGHIDDQQYDAAIAHIRSEFLALGIEPPEE